MLSSGWWQQGSDEAIGWNVCDTIIGVFNASSIGCYTRWCVCVCACVYVCTVYTTHTLSLHNTGIRLYFTTTPDGIIARPSLLALVHIRLPPGYTPSFRQHPGTSVHQAFYRKGKNIILSCTWCFVAAAI